MDKVFEAGEMEMADLRGDPNRVIEIQRKVEELLEANQQRQAGLRLEIREQGAWALPGLINATYVWMNRLKESPFYQDMLGDLMAQLAKDNPAAVTLLFRAGILETPFAVPRSIAQGALRQLGWKPSEKDAQQLRQRITANLRLNDHPTVLNLHASLLMSGKDQDLSSALKLCKDWARQALDQTGDLLKLLIEGFPDQTERVLTEVFLAVAQARDDAYKDKDIAEALLDPLRPIPGKWLEEGIVLRVSTGVLRQLKPPRHTTVEDLWRYAAQDLSSHDSDRWHRLLEPVGQQVAQERHQDICRYWFRAAGEAGETEYIVSQAKVRIEPYGTMAADQLFRCEDSLARQALGDR